MRSIEEALKAAAAALEKQDHARAVELSDQILRHQPRNADAACIAGIGLSQMGKIGLSIGMFNYVLTMMPNDPMMWANMGMTLRRGGHTGWARDAYRKALYLDAKCPMALTGMAGSYVNDGDPAPGVEWGKRAVEVQPDMVMNSHNLALCLMELGRWEEAWPHWRKRVLPRHEARKYPGERWDGSPVDNLVVHGEQGLGDEIMFLGCLVQLMARAKRLTIECAPRLVPLVHRSFTGATVIGSQADYVAPAGGTHAWVPMGDLAELCHNRKPPKISAYLEAPGTGRTDDVLIAMRGGTLETHEYLRNPPAEAWAPVIGAIRARGWRPVSIQYGKDGQALAAELGILHDTEAAGNLTAQADRIFNSRGLVSVQQTALHLGGGLGAAVWGVVSNKPAWRYGMDGPMPWYQTVDLYRQAKDEKDWGPVMARVAASIAAFQRIEVAA